MSGGDPVEVIGTSYELYAMEINIQKARQEIKEAALGDDLLDDLGIGGLSDQIKELNLAELLEHPPPGIDEAVAVSQVSASSAPLSTVRVHGRTGGSVSEESRVQ